MEHQNHPADFSLRNPSEQKVLNLYQQGLREVAESIWDASRLEVLNLGNNELSSLPESLGNLKNLRMLDLGHNHLTAVPEAIGKLTKLRFLYLSDNGFDSVPASIRKLKELADGVPIAPPAEKQVYQPYSNRLYRMPTNREMLPRLSRLGAKYVASKFQAAMYTDQWALAYRFRSGPCDSNNTLYRFKNLIPPKDRFWADPFAVQAGEHYYVFLEEYPYEFAKGHISVIELDRKGVVSGPRKVLERDYHLSYPFVFEWKGSYWMIPESAANKTVELYRAKSFPFVWQLEKVLMTDVRAKDATLAEIDGTWWMFVSISEHSIPDELSLFSAPSPLGPWTPHRRNPVKSDVRGSRPAGALFEWNGEVYRPAQDSSGRYGYAISINRIAQLDHDRFSEEQVSNIFPNWSDDLVATHTISIAGDLTVVDCLRKRSRWR